MAIWDALPSSDTIEKTATKLREHGIDVFIVSDSAAAKQKALEIIPKGAEVMTMTSQTTDAIGLTAELNDSGNYRSVRKRFGELKKDNPEDAREMRRLGAAPDVSTGSVHAVTQDGHVLIASATGSQLAAHVYGAGHVVWVVGAQKIVENIDAGMHRIFEHCLPLEDARARVAYGIGSSVNKVLVVNHEAKQGRITMILVKEKLGF